MVPGWAPGIVATSSSVGLGRAHGQLVFFMGIFSFHFALLVGDWDYWVDWRDRRWWPLVTPLALAVLPGVFGYLLWERLRLPVAGLDVEGQVVDIVTTGRHDPCVGIRATPICEAMLALVLMDQALRHRAQCGDVTPPLKVEKPRKIN